MGDMADDFRFMDEMKKKRKSENLDRNTKKLVDTGVEFEKKAGGYQLVIQHKGKTIDFWPSTSKFHVRGSGKYQSGVNKLLKKLEK